MSSSKLATMLLSGLLLAGPAMAGEREGGRPGPDVIGEEISLDLVRTSSRGAGQAGLAAMRLEDERAASLVWETELFFAGADYIAPHFSKASLPPGAFLVVRNHEGTRSVTYRASDLVGRQDGFWGAHIYGETALVQLYSMGPVKEGALAIDRFARGFSADEMTVSKDPRSPLALCGTDDSQWAKCYQTSQPNAYAKSRAVARLLINGTSACTGWLVGNQGHVLTNEHCITVAADATNTSFEFNAEGATCTTSCASWGACPGTIVATTSTFVKNNAALDYALVKLPTNPTATYGFLQLRSAGATLNERIYIPQHPAAWGKKIAMTDGTANATISSLSAAPCSGGTADLGYNADTQGGSSGSPVLGYNDNLVVGLHHCGTCPNRAVPIQAVITSLGTSLPAGALPGGGGDTVAPTAAITAPASGATVSGTVTVSATGSDTVGVTRMELYIDGALVSSNTSSTSISFSWNTTTAANGSHTLSARAYDAAGNVGTSASRTVTVSNTTLPPSQLLLNPGFESGNVSWTAPAGVITSSTSQAARTGSWKAWMGGNGSAVTETMYQSVAIPASATTATLSFWIRIATAETTTATAYDTLKVEVRSSTGTLLATLATYSNLNKSTTYSQKSFNLAAYKGQTVRVQMVAVEDSSLATSFVIDDTALNVQ